MKSLIYSSLAISALSQDNNNNNNTNNNNNNNDISIPTPPYNPDEVANLYRNLGASDSVIANNFKIKVSQHSQTGLTRSTQSVSYGCWCFFDEMPIMTGQTKPFKPKGKPVDKLDGYCKSLNEAYECVASDYPTDKNGDLCDPRNTPKILTENWWIDINYNMNTPITDAELNQACLTLNNNIDSCEVYICMIEASFLIKFWDKNEDFLNDNAYAQFGYAWDTYGENIDYEGNFYDYDAAHPNFNPHDECVVAPGTGVEDKSCCGDYPNRILYRPKGGMFGCCNGKTFNNLMHACCDNNGNQVVGDIGC